MKCSLCINVCLTYIRLDKELAVLERTNQVAVRWRPTDEQYQTAVQEEVVLQCKQLVEKMKPVSQERLFLLKLKEKYSGKNFANDSTYADIP